MDHCNGGRGAAGDVAKCEVARQIASAVAIAIQNGNAMTYLAGHCRAMAPGGAVKVKGTGLAAKGGKEAGGQAEQ